MQEKAAFVKHQATGPRVRKMSRSVSACMCFSITRFRSRRETLELILLEEGRGDSTAVHCEGLAVSRPEKNTQHTRTSSREDGPAGSGLHMGTPATQLAM